MANWYGSARSNYFAVKDLEAFKQWASGVGLKVLFSNDHPDKVGITPDGTDDGDWPTFRWGVEHEVGKAPEEDEEIDLNHELSQHLVDGEVAVRMTIGAEKLRYLTGWTEAVHSDGRVVGVSINDIYKKALETFGVEPTRAEW